MQRAQDAGVTKILMPNIDEASIAPMLMLEKQWPELTRSMMGLHPCDVKENFREVLSRMKPLFSEHNFVAVGETGIDLYWDKSTLSWQKESFVEQIKWAKKFQLPLVIHARESFPEIFEVLDEHCDSTLRGVFHCFTGTHEQAMKVASYGTFMMGIGGVITYEKSGLAEIVAQIPSSLLLLETDAPFLTPKPHRGKRNEPAMLTFIINKMATALGISADEVIRITEENARKMFAI